MARPNSSQIKQHDLIGQFERLGIKWDVLLYYLPLPFLALKTHFSFPWFSYFFLDKQQKQESRVCKTIFKRMQLRKIENSLQANHLLHSSIKFSCTDLGWFASINPKSNGHLYWGVGFWLLVAEDIRMSWWRKFKVGKTASERPNFFCHCQYKKETSGFKFVLQQTQLVSNTSILNCNFLIIIISSRHVCLHNNPKTF